MSYRSIMDSFSIARSDDPSLGKTFELQRRDDIIQTDFGSSNGYQTGILQFNTKEVMVNNMTYTDLGQSQLEIPLVLQASVATATFNATSMENAFAAGLKSSVLNVIDRITVDLGGTSLVTPVSLSNFYCNFQALTCSDANDLMSYGDTMLFKKDTSESQFYSATTGSTNNVIKDTLFSCYNSGGTNKFANKGRRERMLATSCDRTNDAAMTAIAPADPVLNISYKSQLVESTTTRLTWYILAIIDLRQLHSIFREMPLIKNGEIKMQIFTNTPCTNTLTYGTGQTLQSATFYNQSGGSNPMQISPLSTGNAGTGLNIASNTAAEITLTLDIGKGRAGSFTHPLNGCRLRLSQCRMTDEQESEYAATPVRSFVYQKLFAPAPQLNIASGGTVNFQLQQGISNIRKIIIYSFLSGGIADNNGVTGLSSQNSPFSSEPMTMAPMPYLTNFNIRVNGVPRFLQNLNQRNDFYREFKSATTKMGGGEWNCNNVISQREYDQAYSYYVFDMSRGDRSLDSAPKAISIEFTNSCKKALDFYFHIEYDVACSVNVLQGQVVV